MKLKQWQNIFHVTVNANSIVEYRIQIKNGMIKHANVNVKIIVRAKKIIVGILFVRIVSKYFKKYFGHWMWWNYDCYE